MLNKSNGYGKGKNPFLMVLYMLAVIVLLACIAYFIYSSRARSQAYQETVSKLQEKENQSSEEPESEVRTLNDLLEDAERTGQSETDRETERMTDASDESVVIDYDINIVVLNVYDTDEVASYWVSELQAAGYRNVYMADYGSEVQEYTILYTTDRDNAVPLRTLFGRSVIQIGQAEDRITEIEGADLPEEVDVWVLIGEYDVWS